MTKKIRLIWGVGYNEGERTINDNGTALKSYYKWRGMLERCYSEKYKKEHPTYQGCNVSKEWHSFKVFLLWYNDNYIDGYDLDKDILFDGNKTYSPLTCVFIPHEINTILNKRVRSTVNYPRGVYFDKRRGRIMAQISIYGATKFLGMFNCENEAHKVYVSAKKSYVREVASKYFLDGLICNRVLDSLNRWADNLK